MNNKMTYHLILLLVAIIIFFLVFYMLWKFGRINKQDVLSLTAVIISLAVGLFTLLSRSLPVEIEVYPTATTLFNLPEENKSDLISECLYYDLKNKISPQAITINRQLLSSGINIDDFEKNAFFEKMRGMTFNYDTSLEVVKNFIGKSPCSIPIVFSLSFINKTPNPVIIDELYFILKGNNHKFLYKPMFFVDSQKLFTNNFKKTSEVLDKPFHPFLLTENSDKELHLFCIKWNLFDKDNKANSNELGIGEYTIELNYHTTSNKKYEGDIPAIKIVEKDLITLYNGGKISISNESGFYKELLNK